MEVCGTSDDKRSLAVPLTLVEVPFNPFCVDKISGSKGTPVETQRREQSEAV